MTIVVPEWFLIVVVGGGVALLVLRSLLFAYDEWRIDYALWRDAHGPVMSPRTASALRLLALPLSAALFAVLVGVWGRP